MSNLNEAIKRYNEWGVISLTKDELYQIDTHLVKFAGITLEEKGSFMHEIKQNLDEFSVIIDLAIEMENSPWREILSRETILAYTKMERESVSIEEFEQLDEKQRQEILNKHLTLIQMQEIVDLLSIDDFEGSYDDFNNLNFMLESIHYDTIYKIIEDNGKNIKKDNNSQNLGI